MRDDADPSLFCSCNVITCRRWSAVTQDGNQYWFANSGTSSGSGYTLGYAPLGYFSTAQYPNGAAVAILGTMGAKYVDFNPATGNLFMTAQRFQPTAGSGSSLATGVWTTTGAPTTSSSWTLVGGQTLAVPRGFTFFNASTLFVCDADSGLVRMLLSGSTWTTDINVYVPGSPPIDTFVMQSALGADRATLFVVTPTSLYGFVVSTLSWLNGGAPLATAGPNTEFRGVALAPSLPSPTPTPVPPRVNSTIVYAAENSVAGAIIGTALGAALPATPQTSWQILSGATGVSGNGLVNVTGFQILPCSGQISLVSPVLNWVSQPVWVLLVRAFFQDATYAVYPEVCICVWGGVGIM